MGHIQKRHDKVKNAEIQHDRLRCSDDTNPNVLPAGFAVPFPFFAKAFRSEVKGAFLCCPQAELVQSC